MFSRCPHCETQQPVTTQQLRESRGLLNCVACGQPFDALPSLSEQVDEVVVRQDDAAFSLLQADRANSERPWRIGSLAMILALMAQLVYFEADRLNRLPVFHNLLTAVCQALDCRIPAYKNPEEWALSHSELQAQLDKHYQLLTGALTNQAGLPQAFPELKLTLMDFNGRPLAERIFEPQQYADSVGLAASQTIQIRIPLVVPAEVGGFSLTLI